MKGLINASGKPRLLPNPNVLIEYGYALKCHSDVALIGIMNTACGDPESLPFDLRHRRWPITYRLSDPAATDKAEQFEKLVGTLGKALGLILSNQTMPVTPEEKFVPQPPTTSAAVYFNGAEELIPKGSFGPNQKFTIPDESKPKSLAN